MGVPVPNRAPWAAALVLTVLALGATLARPGPTARQIVADARWAHGVAVLDTAGITFTFRGTPYRVAPLGGLRTVARARPLPDSLGGGRATETLGPNGTVTRRADDGRPDTLRGDDAARVASSIGSVVYFALLPHGLADPAVRLRRLPDDVLGGRAVRTVEVTFDSTGGGRSWRDRYVYWFDARRHTLDAFAYDYEDGDGETRLRLATRAHTLGGVRLQDYSTFTDSAMKGRIEHYLTRIGTPTLRPVSEVNLADVRLLPR